MGYEGAMSSSSPRTRDTSLNRLSALFVKQARTPGIYLDGGGLRFQVTRSGGKRWFMRVTVGCQARDIALGRAETVSLAEAREMAAAVRKAIVEGRDPARAIDLTGARDVPSNRGHDNPPSFRDAWEAFWALKAPQLKTAKNRLLWANMVERYALTRIGERPVADIRPAEIIEMLRPIWATKAETGRKVLQRVDAVFQSAITREWRERASPCIGVAKELGIRRAGATHFASMHYLDVPDFLQSLRSRGGLLSSRLCLELIVLTGVRSGEARGARWSEIDLAAATWTIPRERMKMGIAHIVPLSTRAMEVLAEAKAAAPDSELIFPGSIGQPLSDMTLLKRLRDMGLGGRATIHGFRSSFKDWCADTGVRDEVSEAALAHADRNTVRAAYRRTNYLEERRELMQRWADHCCGSPQTNGDAS